MQNLKLAVKIGLGFGLLIVITLALGGVAVWKMDDVKDDATAMVQQFVPEVTIANELERTALLTMYNLRGYNYSEDKKFLEVGRKYLEEAKGHLKEGEALAARFSHLVQLRQGLETARAKLTEYEDLTNDTETRIKTLQAQRQSLLDLASTFMKNCEGYLADQEEDLKREIKAGVEPAKLLERYEKIADINGVIDRGNWVRIANFRAQALRDPKIVQEAQKYFDEVDQKLSAIRAQTRRQKNLEELEKIKSAALAYKNTLGELLQNWTGLQEIGAKRNVVGGMVLKANQEISQTGLGETKGKAENSLTDLTSASSLLLVGLGLAVVIGIVLAICITLGITRPITRIIAALTEGADQVTAASSQVSSASQQLAEGASEQAAALEETSSSLEEMSSMTTQNADNATQANSLMADADNVVATANTSMTELTASMRDISTASDETAKIIKTIDEIAFQTNLLALNAAVEAARAGEAGAGFAVVADEVRNLAMRAAEAAKNTAALIETTVTRIRGGSELVARTSEAFAQVRASTARVKDLVGEIAAASNEQAQGVQQISRAVNEMDKVVQANAANAEESASASEELSAQSEQMKGVVGELVMLVGGRQNGQSASPGRSLTAALPGGASHKLLSLVPKRKAPARMTAPAGQARIVSPEQVIPLDDEQFRDF